MASNKKWVKRALRALSYGDTVLWNIIKEKLAPERRAYLEDKFLKNEKLDEAKKEDTPIQLKSEEKEDKKTLKSKTTTRKRSSKKTTSMKKKKITANREK
jgi:hypothetical protein